MVTGRVLHWTHKEISGWLTEATIVSCGFQESTRSGTIAKQADVVLGQSTFTSNEAGQSLDRMNSPSALDFGPDMTPTSLTRPTIAPWCFILRSRPACVTSLFGSNLDDPLGLEA